jgi:hypothetical protein
MINNGDRVKVIMTNNELSSGRGCAFEAKLLYSPQGAGDCFHLELQDGKQLILNGNSSDFVGIMEIEQ